MTGDRGDIVLGWLTRLVLVLSALGLVGFDGVSLVAARFQAEDHAQAAVRAAAGAWSGPLDLQRAYDAAVAEVAGSGDVVDAPSFAVAPDGTVTLTLHRTAHTLLLHRVGPLRQYAEVAQTVTGRPPR